MLAPALLHVALAFILVRKGGFAMGFCDGFDWLLGWAGTSLSNFAYTGEIRPTAMETAMKKVLALVSQSEGTNILP